MSLAFSNDFMTLSQTDDLVEFVRSSRAFVDLAEIERVMVPVHAAMSGLPRQQLGLLCDLRQVVGRNDDAFEAAFKPHRQRLQDGFARVAVLVATPAGVLHIQRLAAEDGDEHLRAFTERERAVAWASAPRHS